MEVEQMQRSFIEYSSGLFHEGLLDGQFSELQDESNLVFEVVSLFFEDSSSHIYCFNVDFKKIDAHVHQLKDGATDCDCWWTNSHVQ